MEQLREQVSMATLAAVLARSQGADAPMPDPDQIRVDFDTALAAVPEQIANPDEYVLKQALGLR